MTEDQVKAIFLLANMEIQELQSRPNGYWPDHPDYDESRKRDPWWLVKTEFGEIEIGWRKRVINIDWSRTPLRLDKNAKWEYEHHRVPLTRDDVTMWDEGIHAWTVGRAIDYLQEFKIRIRQHNWATSPEGIVKCAERKQEYEKEQVAVQAKKG
jgi:hypothetical protein